MFHIRVKYRTEQDVDGEKSFFASANRQIPLAREKMSLESKKSFSNYAIFYFFPFLTQTACYVES